MEREVVGAKRGLGSETAGITDLPRCARGRKFRREADRALWAPPAPRRPRRRQPTGPAAVACAAEARALMTALSAAGRIRCITSSSNDSSLGDGCGHGCGHRRGSAGARAKARAAAAGGAATWGAAHAMLVALALTMTAVTASVIADGPGARAAAMGLAQTGAQTGVQVQAQAPSTQGGQLAAQREAVEQDLVWLLAGIMDMDRDKKLALTRKQAADIWPTFKALVDKGVIRLEVDPALFEFGNRSGWQGPVPGQTQGQTQGQGGGPSQVDSARAQEFRKQRKAREEALRQAIDDIEKVLSAKQLSYVDNFDFNPADYGLAPRLGGARPQAVQNQNQGQWSPPSREELQKFMKTARENAQRLADFYKKFQTFIQKKAGIKA